MGVLQDFERRLEGAVEGFFARAFRGGLQPVELAKALQRYMADNQHVTADDVVVPNVFRFRISTQDAERLASYGDVLGDELADVVERTAADRDWRLRGAAGVQVEESDDVARGRYELAGRVEPGPRTPDPAGAPSEAPSGGRSGAQDGGDLRVTGGSDGAVSLTGTRLVAGRLASCDITVDDPTVSREHAAFVRRGDGWWVVDLGSTNGTVVNGARVSEERLEPGDTVELGESKLAVVEE